MSFLVTPICAILEGLGKVKDVAKIRLITQSVMQPLLWLSLLSGAKLYSSAIVSLTTPIIILALVYKQHFQLLKKTYIIRITNKISYKTEIFPYQWKIALSLISGYFIFQIFNPIVFVAEGVVMEGKMGMTITILAAIQSITMSWMTTKIPILSNLISLRKYRELDALFNKTLKIQLSLAGLALIAMLVAVYALNYFEIRIGGKLMSERILPYYPMIMIPKFIQPVYWVDCNISAMSQKRTLLILFHNLCSVECTISSDIRQVVWSKWYHNKLLFNNTIIASLGALFIHL